MDLKDKYSNLPEAVAALAQGDKDAFDQLYYTYVGKVYNFYLKISFGNDSLAEDLTQELFIKVWQKREEMDTEKNFEAWLFVCARNLFLNAMRRRGQDIAYSSWVGKMFREKENDSGTMDEIDYRFAEQKMAEIVGKMPPQRRKAFVLARVYGLSAAEVAEQMGISERTVENHIYQARKFISSMIDEKID